jgi:hypothetical protein
MTEMTARARSGWRGRDGDVGRYRGGEGDNAIRAGNERLGMHK